jgi:hypothetical protein
VSKTEGLPNFVLEKLKIINTNENSAHEGFISIKSTSDTNQKAWLKKKQLVYKLSKTENVTEYISDIIVLSKFKSPPPEGFKYLGELEKVHLCFKTSTTNQMKSSSSTSEIIDFTRHIEDLKIQSNLINSSVS